jgi:hypothetical protein
MISPWAYTRVGCQPRGGLPALSVSECDGLIFGWAYSDGRSLLISYCYPDITSSGQELRVFTENWESGEAMRRLDLAVFGHALASVLFELSNMGRADI